MTAATINIHQPATANGRLWARWGFDPVLGVLNGVYAEWENGFFVKITESPRPPRECAPAECYPDHLLTPGLLNAHAHLDYAFLRGALPRGKGFAPWLRAMIQARRTLDPAGEPARRQACLDSIQELARSGATEVWDVSSFGWARQMLLSSALGGITFEEWIAPRQATWEPAWQAWLARFRRECLPLEDVSRGRLAAGISAHSTYSVCPAALQEVANLTTHNRHPLAIHVAESPEENKMLMEGTGALTELLAEISGNDPTIDIGIGFTPLRRVAAAGALGPQLLAIHGNLPQPEDCRKLGESGAVVVFCPRSHAFFGYPPYPLKAYRRARVRLALGTDSLASNDSLDMREEVRTFAALATEWSPGEILGVATGAALGESLPYGGRGQLRPWHPARWALWRMETVPEDPTCEVLLASLLDPEMRLSRSSAMILDIPEAME